MGNCLNTASKQQEARRRRGERVVPEEREEEVRSIGQVLLHDEEEEQEEEAPSTAPVAGVKVKVVLTRAELEWLMAQLKSGEQRLEDVLRQMGTARTGAPDDASKPSPRAVDGWRPRLERILECPEPVDAT
uniref:Uncharacterized protein n=1 Tax=Avena sativa TaxID=4498 RepID=A0ACD5WYM7_AVESA